MSIHRYAARTDENKAAIVAAFRSMGCSVYDLRMPVDLLVGRNGKTLLVEVKDGKKAPSAQKYTKAQESFMSTWLGGPVSRVTDVEGAIRAAEMLRDT